MPQASIAERALSTAQTSVRLKIKRQDEPNGKSYWEEFSVPYAKNMNVISALQQVQRNPKTAGGKGSRARGLGMQLP